jgi:ribosome-associated protein
LIEHQLKGEFIELIKLLKFSGLVGTGGEAKMVVEDGEVQVNEQIESRKRAKLRRGDKIEFRGEVIKII